MKLSELMQNYPGFSVATKNDNQAILDFFNEIPMKGNLINLSYHRSPDFFKFLYFNQGNPIVMLARDEKNNIIGVATLIIRQGRINGELQNIGYLGDLRVKPSLKLAIKWRKFYGELINRSLEIEELKGTKYFYTCILEDNKQGMNTLVFSDKNSFKYTKIDHYRMINIYKRIYPKKGKYNFKKLQNKDYEKVEKFILDERKNSALAYPATEWRDRFQRWDNYGPDNFYLFYFEEELVGVAGLWSPSPFKKIIIKDLAKPVHWLIKAIRPFINLPLKGEEIKPLYLTNLTVKDTHKKALNDFLNFIYKNNLNHGHHVISFCDFDTKNYTKILNGFVFAGINLNLYRVDPKSRELQVMGQGEPEFEMSLI